MKLCPPFAYGRLLLVYSVMPALLLSSARAQRINYAENVQPLVEANCAKCHNPDKKKADLDLTSFQGALKGSGSGAIVVSGNPDGSKLWKALTHAEEPFMPPNRPKLSDKELEVFKRWIADGLLENAGAKAIAAAKPGVDLTLKPEDLARPEGPPPMPKQLPLETVVHTDRGGVILGFAASPWAPLLAVAGQKEVLLFHADTLELLGILPFEEGQPVDLKFSHNGKLLLAAGGWGARSGRVVVWDITTGERLMTLGQEYDTVLAADIRPDQSMVALGGPNRLVKLFSTKTGELQQKIKKHTDWVTAVAFSPNGQVLATADRNGGISLWDPDSAQELFTLPGHKAAVTALSWRPDSKLLASASEDGTVALWDAKEGKQVKSWSAHGSGALDVSYAPDGQLVTCGRDNVVILWNGTGGKVRALDFPGSLPLRVAFSADSKRVFAGDFVGRVSVWSTEQPKPIAQFGIDPLPLSDQLAAAQTRLSQVQTLANQAAQKLAGLQTKKQQAESELQSAKNALETCRTNLASASTNAPSASTNAVAADPMALTNATQKVASLNQALAQAEADLAKAQQQDYTAALEQAQGQVGRLQAAQLWSQIYRGREALAARKRQQQALAAGLLASQQAATEAEKQLAAARQAALQAQEKLKTAKSDTAKTQPALKQLDAQLQADQSRIDEWLRQYQSLTEPPPTLAQKSAH